MPRQSTYLQGVFRVQRLHATQPVDDHGRPRLVDYVAISPARVEELWDGRQRTQCREVLGTHRTKQRGDALEVPPVGAKREAAIDVGQPVSSTRADSIEQRGAAQAWAERVRDGAGRGRRGGERCGCGCGCGSAVCDLTPRVELLGRPSNSTFRGREGEAKPSAATARGHQHKEGALGRPVRDHRNHPA
jgi:hypothetical protein